MRGALIILAGISLATGCERLLGPQGNLLLCEGKEFDPPRSLTAENAGEFLKSYLACSKAVGHPATSSSWFHNLGNAHFLAEQLPEAILAYQHGLKLDPGDAGLRANLDYARARVQYPFGE